MYGGMDAFNARMTEEKKGLSLPEVLRQMNDIRGRLIDFIEAVPEDQFRGETRFVIVCASTHTATIRSTPGQYENGGREGFLAIFGRTQGEGVMKNRQYSQFALLTMANRKHNEHRHIRSAISELLAAELDLKNDGNGTGVGRLTVLDRIHEALAELRGIDEQIQLGNTAIADETSTI